MREMTGLEERGGGGMGRLGMGRWGRRSRGGELWGMGDRQGTVRHCGEGRGTGEGKWGTGGERMEI